jgi:5'-3' exonuclease
MTLLYFTGVTWVTSLETVMESDERKIKRDQFIELRAISEMSFDKCTTILKVSKPTLIKWEKEFKDQITALKSTTQAVFMDSLELGIRSRIKRLRNLSERLETEIKNTDLAMIQSEKLIKLFLDTESKLSDLIVEYMPDQKEDELKTQELILKCIVESLDEDEMNL